jgi:Tol biopolymer transport system component
MNRSITLITAAALAATALPVTAGASPPADNGQIAFGRYDSGGEPHVVIADPDGMGEHELPLIPASDNGVWSPDGSRLLVGVFLPDRPARPALVDPDGSHFTPLDVPDARTDMDMGCRAWSPDGGRLLCIGLDSGDHHEVDGLYTIRASDGGDLTRLTINPYPPIGDFGGGDIPGDYSPDGTRVVFMRAKPGAGPVPDRNQTGALFVARTDGSQLRQLTPYGLANSHDDGVARWSPDGTRILFAGARGSLFVVHPDGTGLRKVPLDTGGGFSFARAPGWSPDGTRIVFSLYLDEAGQVDIYTSRSDGSHLRPVTDTPEFETLPDWGTHPLASTPR